ncbi:MAG: transketolase C-terminal domain-containing protein [Dehalococcoidia bacterium]|nr:transketolase C-terminal domain-containing protein [Dehalococcoidia bacterium]
MSIQDNVKSFFEVLLELGEADPNVFVISQDMGSVGPFAQRFPDRAIDVGITEQNLVGVAAGLAIRGKLPFIYGMAPFVTMRAFEQIRTDLAYNGRNVKILAVFTGLAAGAWGATHHALEDIALMRAIPGMTVIAPADMHETERAVRAAAAHPGPVYLRLGAFLPVHEQEYDFEIGRAITLRKGTDAAIIATGNMVWAALQARESLQQRGVAARVIDMHTVKPLDAEAVRKAAAETGRLVTAEEHSVIGGLGSAVAEVLAETGAGRLARVGVRDVFCTEVASYPELCAMHGVTAEGIERAILSLL